MTCKTEDVKVRIGANYQRAGDISVPTWVDMSQVSLELFVGKLVDSSDDIGAKGPVSVLATIDHQAAPRDVSSMKTPTNNRTYVGGSGGVRCDRFKSLGWGFGCFCCLRFVLFPIHLVQSKVVEFIFDRYSSFRSSRR